MTPTPGGDALNRDRSGRCNAWRLQIYFVRSRKHMSQDTLLVHELLNFIIYRSAMNRGIATKRPREVTSKLETPPCRELSGSIKEHIKRLSTLLDRTLRAQKANPGVPGVDARIIGLKNAIDLWKYVVALQTHPTSAVAPGELESLMQKLQRTRLKPRQNIALPVRASAVEFPPELSPMHDTSLVELIRCTQADYIKSIFSDPEKRPQRDAMLSWQTTADGAGDPAHRTINNNLLKSARDGLEYPSSASPPPRWWATAAILYRVVVNAPRLEVFALLARGLRSRKRLPCSDFYTANKRKMEVGETMLLPTFLSCANASADNVFCSHGPGALMPSCNLPLESDCPQMELLVAPGTPFLAFFVHESELAHENEVLIPPGVRLTYLGEAGEDTDAVQQYLVTPMEECD